MHAGGLVGDHTTASMVIELGENRILIWATGSSTPCISLFKPYSFGAPVCAPVFNKGDLDALKYWHTREEFHRAAVGKVLPQAFYQERDMLEQEWILAVKDSDAKEIAEISAQAITQELDFYGRWSQRLPEEYACKRRFLNYWKQKTLRLETPDQPCRPECRPLP